MTTATAPPLLDPPATPDSDLAPLLDDRQRACELTDCRPRIAIWAVSIRCSCNPSSPNRMLVCGMCLKEHDGGNPIWCDECLDDVAVTEREPLR